MVWNFWFDFFLEVGTAKDPQLLKWNNLCLRLIRRNSYLLAMLLRELARWSGTAASPDMIWEQTITPQGCCSHAWQCEVGDVAAPSSPTTTGDFGAPMVLKGERWRRVFTPQKSKGWGKIQSTIGSALRKLQNQKHSKTLQRKLTQVPAGTIMSVLL